MRNKRLDIGTKYNELTVVDFHHVGSRGRSYYLFQCTCGKQKVILGIGVTSGNTKSCGCYRKRFNKTLLPNDLAVKKHIILQYKRHAKRRNLAFDITEQEFIELILQPCHYCGTEPSNNKKIKNHMNGFLYSGIDRVDSSMGYNKENCVPCCEKCNRAKLVMSKEEFLSWIKAVYMHMYTI